MEVRAETVEIWNQRVKDFRVTKHQTPLLLLQIKNHGLTAYMSSDTCVMQFLCV